MQKINTSCDDAKKRTKNKLHMLDKKCRPEQTDTTICNGETIYIIEENFIRKKQCTVFD